MSAQAKRTTPTRPALNALLRVLLVLCTLTWWVLPGMGLVDLSVTWDPDWPVMLEAGWGLLFTIGLGLPFLVAAARPRLARASLLQLYVVTAGLLVAVAAGLEPQAWWIFLGLALEIPLVHAVALPTSNATVPATRTTRDPGPWIPRLILLTLAVVSAPIALAYAWDMSRMNRLSQLTSDITNGVDHYAVQAALAITLVALPAVAAWAATARGLLGTSAALMAAYLGVVSYNWPGVAAGFGAGWSLAVVGWALAVLAASWWPSRD